MHCSISVQITCHPQQDTDQDFSEGDSDNLIEMIAFEHCHSSPAYINDEVAEVFELY